MATQEKNTLLNNSRFYILLSSILLSVMVFSWLRLAIASDQLFYIRTQQVFGLLSILYWYLALIISPLGYAIGKQRTKRLEFARRAIGVSAFYFALLHIVISIWGQLGGLTQLQYLPALFQWSLIFGALAFLILMVLAATSFNAAVSFMTQKRWKLLHRTIYIGGVLAILHIWMVGTHLAYTGVQLTAFALLVILTGLELYKLTRKLNERYFHLSASEMVTLFVTAWAVVSLLIFMIPVAVSNYHSRHAEHSESSRHEDVR